MMLHKWRLRAVVLLGIAYAAIGFSLLPIVLLFAAFSLGYVYWGVPLVILLVGIYVGIFIIGIRAGWRWAHQPEISN